MFSPKQINILELSFIPDGESENERPLLLECGIDSKNHEDSGARFDNPNSFAKRVSAMKKYMS
jgi:hypothetical protein